MIELLQDKMNNDIAVYRAYLERIIGAADRAVKATGLEHHKGALKAYRDALKRCPKSKTSATNGHGLL